MDETPLDRAATGDRMQFFNLFASAELFLLLTAQPKGEEVEPELFETDQGRFILAFDREERLAQFVGKPAPFAALSGRVLAETLAGQGIGVALNPEVAASSELIPAEAIDWLHQTLAPSPVETGARPETLSVPQVPQALLVTLDTKLAAAGGAARCAFLVAVSYQGGRQGHLLAFIDAAPHAQAGLAQAVSEALVFSGLDAAELDVAFFDASDPMSARLAKHGLRFDLPAAQQAAQPTAPGLDPARPPKLR